MDFLIFNQGPTLLSIDRGPAQLLKSSINFEDSIKILDSAILSGVTIVAVGLACYLGYNLYIQYYGQNCGNSGNNIERNSDLDGENAHVPDINLDPVVTSDATISNTATNQHIEPVAPVNVFDDDLIVAENAVEEPTLWEQLHDENSEFHTAYITFMSEEYDLIIENEGVTRFFMDQVDPDCLQIVLAHALDHFDVYAPIPFYSFIRAILTMRIRTFICYYQRVSDFTEQTEIDEMFSL
jgi:hypothetical protein